MHERVYGVVYSPCRVVDDCHQGLHCSRGEWGAPQAVELGSDVAREVSVVGLLRWKLILPHPHKRSTSVIFRGTGLGRTSITARRWLMLLKAS